MVRVEFGSIYKIAMFICFFNIIYVKGMQNQRYVPIFPTPILEIFHNKNIKITGHYGSVLELPIFTHFITTFAMEGNFEENGRNFDVYILLVKKDIFTKTLTIEDSKKKKHGFKVKESKFKILKKYTHKNILKIWDIIKAGSFYCIIQERNDKLKKLYEVLQNNNPSLWSRKKMMLSNIYSFMYLHSLNIFRNKESFLFTPIDEFYNIKSGLLLQTRLTNKSTMFEDKRLYFYQNLVFDLYEMKSHSKSIVNEIKNNLLQKDRSEFYGFCMHLMEMGGEGNFVEELNQFKGFLANLNAKNEKYFEKILNNEFFKENIILIPDFRKWRYGEQRMSTFVLKHMKNKLIFEFIYKPEIIEIEFIESEYHIKMDSDLIHYRSLKIIIDGVLLDIDCLNEKSFKNFQSKLDVLFLEINFYINEKIMIEIYNEYFNFLFLEESGHYKLIYKKNNRDNCLNLYFIVNNETLTVLNILDSIAYDKREENLKNIKLFIMNLIENRDVHDKILFKKSGIHLINHGKIGSCCDDIVTLPYVYIPGLGIRKEEKKGGFVVYFLDNYSIELKPGMRFYKKAMTSKNLETSEEIYDRSEFIETLCHLLEASFVKIQV